MQKLVNNESRLYYHKFSESYSYQRIDGLSKAAEIQLINLRKNKIVNLAALRKPISLGISSF